MSTLSVGTIRSTATTPPVIQNSAGTAIGTFCRAWVNINGTAAPASIRASFNVSSITDNATGDFTVNFTTAMTDANYAFVTNIEFNNTSFNSGIGTSGARLGGLASGSLRINSGSIGGTLTDYANISVSIHR